MFRAKASKHSAPEADVQIVHMGDVGDIAKYEEAGQKAKKLIASWYPKGNYSILVVQAGNTNGFQVRVNKVLVFDKLVLNMGFLTDASVEHQALVRDAIDAVHKGKPIRGVQEEFDKEMEARKKRQEVEEEVLQKKQQEEDEAARKLAADAKMKAEIEAAAAAVATAAAQEKKRKAEEKKQKAVEEAQKKKQELLEARAAAAAEARERARIRNEEAKAKEEEERERLKAMEAEQALANEAKARRQVREKAEREAKASADTSFFACCRRSPNTDDDVDEPMVLPTLA